MLRPLQRLVKLVRVLGKQRSHKRSSKTSLVRNWRVLKVVTWLVSHLKVLVQMRRFRTIKTMKNMMMMMSMKMNMLLKRRHT